MDITNSILHIISENKQKGWETTRYIHPDLFPAVQTGTVN